MGCLGIVMLCLHWGVVPATWFPVPRWSALPLTNFGHKPTSHHSSIISRLFDLLPCPNATWIYLGPEVLCSMLLSRLLATMVAFVVICFLHLSSKTRFFSMALCHCDVLGRSECTVVNIH